MNENKPNMLKIVLILGFALLIIVGFASWMFGEPTVVVENEDRIGVITETCDRILVDGRLWIWCDTWRGEGIASEPTPFVAQGQ